MRPCEIKDRSRLVDAAAGRISCDLSIVNVRLVNMLTGEIYPAEVDILDGAVARVRQEGTPATLPARQRYDGGGRYLMPGLIDTHMHVESTMLIPQWAARAILPWGTTTVCTDPHEIANVAGRQGVAFMLDNARRAGLRQYILAPSCVPAVPGLESAGASFSAQDVAELLDMPGVIGIAEMMDYIGLAHGAERMRDIAAEGLRRGAYLQGHAPGASGSVLAAYRAAGPVSDHESGSAPEVREKLRCGLHVNLRASSIVDQLEELTQGLEGMGWLDQVSICTDDVHAKDLMDKGHVNATVARLIHGGMDPLQAYKLATWNAAREYGLDDLGAIAPGYLADMQLLDRLDGSRPYAVFVRGQLAALEGAYVLQDGSNQCALTPANTIRVTDVTCAEDFLLPAGEGCQRARVLLLNRGAHAAREWVELPVRNGYVSLEEHPELCFVAVLNRYGTGGRTIAVTRDFGLREGAIASTVSHDSHNLTMAYRDADSALACLRQLEQTGGGMCAARNGACFAILPLPVGGLMSLEPCAAVVPQVERVEQAMQSLCDKPFSLLDIAIYALPVVPGLVITDRGVVDGISQTFVQYIKPCEAKSNG